jgi:hypothetical protein
MEIYTRVLLVALKWLFRTIGLESLCGVVSFVQENATLELLYGLLLF